MSDTKKPGGRDISELKQRLGLRKPAPTVQPGSAPGSSAAPSSGLLPPPGLAPAPPPRPAIPNAQDDPFGAMNAIAAQGAVQRAPEIVIVNDGKPVENVGAESHASTILKIAGPGLVALLIGIAVGKIGTSASSYNEGLKGARAILGDKQTPSSVTFLKKQLSDLDTALDEVRTQKQFKPDLAVDKMLKDAALKLDVKSDLVFRAKQNSLDHELSGQILRFYAGVAEIKAMIEQHNVAAIGDDMSLKRAKDAAAAADATAVAGQFKYGVLIQAPTEADQSSFGAKIVLLTGVYCGGGNVPSAKCPEGESPSAFAYQNEPGGTPIKGDYVTSGSDHVPTKKLVALLPNGIRDSLIKGAEPTVSEVYYARRLRAIYDRIRGKEGKSAGSLLEDGNKLQTRLQAEANKSPRFSFFM